MRISDLDTSRGDACPSGWAKITTPIAACIVWWPQSRLDEDC